VADANGRRTSTATTAALAEAELTGTTAANGNQLRAGECPVAHLDAGNDLLTRCVREGLLRAGDVLPYESLAGALLRNGVIGS
jgi:hypothetical protein